MHGKGVALEVEFKEMNNERYTQMFIEALQGRFKKELTEDQLARLAPVIEQARVGAINPVDLAQNLAQNWEAILA